MKRTDKIDDIRLQNGVVIKGNLLVGELTIAEKREQLASQNIKMTREDARACQFTEEEIAREFDK